MVCLPRNTLSHQDREALVRIARNSAIYWDDDVEEEVYDGDIKNGEPLRFERVNTSADS